MASSRDKAISLKDNYVAGLIEAGATAPMPTMPEQSFGDTASVRVNVDSGRTYYINDNNPIRIEASPQLGIKNVRSGSEYANPIKIEEAGGDNNWELPLHKSIEHNIRWAVPGLTPDNTPDGAYYVRHMPFTQQSLIENGNLQRMTDADRDYMWYPINSRNNPNGFEVKPKPGKVPGGLPI